jgi:hypothetical protein
MKGFEFMQESGSEVKHYIGFLKHQVGYWETQIERYGPDHPRHRPAKIARYRQLLRDTSSLIQFLERLDREAFERGPQPLVEDQQVYVPQRIGYSTQPGPSPMPIRMKATPIAPPPPAPSPAPTPSPASSADDDLSDLPPELLKELSDSAKGEKDVVLKIIDDRGGTATLDEILIDLWRKHKEIGKRPIVANKLYRLGRRHLVWTVGGKKGVYTTIKPVGADANAADDDGGDDTSENDEGPGAATSGPSNQMGAAGSPVGPTKSAPNGPTPFASTVIRRKLMSETSIPVDRLPVAK